MLSKPFVTSSKIKIDLLKYNDLANAILLISPPLRLSPFDVIKDSIPSGNFEIKDSRQAISITLCNKDSS